MNLSYRCKPISVCGFVVLFGFGPVWLATAQEPIAFHASLDEARAVDDEKPVVMIFSASWCSSCRMLRDNTLSSETVRQVAPRFLWVDIDVDDDPLTATIFGAAAVPTIVVLNSRDQPIGVHAGFLAPDPLIEFIDRCIENPLTMPATVFALLAQLQDTELADEEQFLVVQEITELLSDQARQDRFAVLHELRPHRAALVPSLIVLLDDPELAQRATAGQILASLSQSPVRFDPFAPAETRRNQIQKIETDLR